MAGKIGARAVIPVRRQGDGFRMRGRHRRQMRVWFESGEILEIYGQRGKTETIFSVIKREDVWIVCQRA
jgi:hypothetical protein